MGRPSGHPGDSVGRGTHLIQVLLALPGPGEGVGAFTCPVRRVVVHGGSGPEPRVKADLVFSPARTVF